MKKSEAPERIHVPALYHRVNVTSRICNFDIEYIRIDKYKELEADYNKAQAEIEELTDSLGVYYDLNNKLEQQIKDMQYEEKYH